MLGFLRGASGREAHVLLLYYAAKKKQIIEIVKYVLHGHNNKPLSLALSVVNKIIEA